MSDPRSFAPSPPEWAVDWSGLETAYAWVRALSACPQDPEWHAEGDVGIHTQMVLEELASLPAWRSLPGEEREAVFLAALLHDVEKPSTTKTEADGRITARNHSRRGALRARRILWELDVPFHVRELVCAIVRHHQVPFWLVSRDDAVHAAIRLSWTLRCDLLALVTEADGRGRECADRDALLENVELFRVLCDEHGILDRPFAFPSDQHRFLYLRDGSRWPDGPVAPEPEHEVVVLSGLPAAGKDHWIERHGSGRPVVSLDRLRLELGVDPGSDQGSVIHAARARAREHLRARRSFIWNATNLSREVRGRVIDLAADYGARVRLVYVEAAREEWLVRGIARRAEGEKDIPARALERMLERWEVPRGTEGHRVEYWIRGELFGAMPHGCRV